MHNRGNNNDDQLRFSFHNTRSKFYKKKESDMDSGENGFKEFTQNNTGNYWKQQGNLQFKKGNLNKAIEYYTKAIQKSPGESIYYCNRAKCYKILGKFKSALKDAEDACQLQPQNIKANYICGCILAELAKQDKTKLSKADNRFKKALRLCSSMKNQQYQEEISIKYYRLKKLKYFLQQEEEIEDLVTQTKLLTQKGINNQPNCKRILARIQKRLLELRNPKKKEIPDYLCCKITLQLMEEPRTTEDGLTYEKSALEDHFKKIGFIQPITRKRLTTQPYPNVALKNAVQDFLKENPWAYQHEAQDNYKEIKF